MWLIGKTLSDIKVSRESWINGVTIDIDGTKKPPRAKKTRAIETNEEILEEKNRRKLGQKETGKK